MEGPHLKCRSCRAALYDFADLSFLETESKVIVRPEVASKRKATVSKYANDDTANGSCPMSIYCSNCNDRIGAVQSDAISETKQEEISAKHVTVATSRGEQNVDDWRKISAFLEENGVTRLSQKDFLDQAGSSKYSRESQPVVMTNMVDVDLTPQDVLGQLVQTSMRNYQMEMLRFSLNQNSLVCLPTGSGKTLIAAAVVKAMLHLNPQKVAAFVVNTNPLVEQQSRALEMDAPSIRVITVSGQMDPVLRRRNLKAIWKFEFDVLVCTCECLNRLMDISSIRPEDLCCLVLDEAHQTKGNSSYANLVKKIQTKNVDDLQKPLLLGMTASPLETVSQKDDEARMCDRISKLTDSLNCKPCYPIEHDPYENGIAKPVDEPITITPGEEEEKFKHDLDNYLRCVVDLVKSRLSTVASEFQSLYQLLNASGDTYDTNQFRNRLRKIQTQLDEAGEKDLERRDHKDIYYGYAVRDHLNQILAVHEINTNIGHEFAKERLKEIFNEIEDPAPGQERRKKDILYKYAPIDTLYCS